jgi:hypothetical protein
MKFEKMTDRQLESWVRTASRLLESATLEADMRGIDIYENQTINEAPPLQKPWYGTDDKKAARTAGKEVNAYRYGDKHKKKTGVQETGLPVIARGPDTADDKKAARTKGAYPKKGKTAPMNEAPPLQRPNPYGVDDAKAKRTKGVAPRKQMASEAINRTKRLSGL